VHDLFKTALVVCRIVAPRELMTSVEARQHCLCALIVETDEKLTECSNYARKSSVNKKFAISLAVLTTYPSYTYEQRQHVPLYIASRGWEESPAVADFPRDDSVRRTHLFVVVRSKYVLDASEIIRNHKLYENLRHVTFVWSSVQEMTR